MSSTNALRNKLICYSFCEGAKYISIVDSAIRWANINSVWQEMYLWCFPFFSNHTSSPKYKCLRINIFVNECLRVACTTLNSKNTSRLRLILIVTSIYDLDLWVLMVLKLTHIFKICCGHVLCPLTKCSHFLNHSSVEHRWFPFLPPIHKQIVDLFKHSTKDLYIPHPM